MAKLAIGSNTIQDKTVKSIYNAILSHFLSDHFGEVYTSMISHIKDTIIRSIAGINLARIIPKIAPTPDIISPNPKNKNAWFSTETLVSFLKLFVVLFTYIVKYLIFKTYI